MSRILFQCLIMLTAAGMHAQMNDATRIPTGPGPEDLVIAQLDSTRMLLASCAPRAGMEGKAGIFCILPDAGKSFNLPRIGEPDSILFLPHGISFAAIEGIPYLYVIIHDDERGIHPIVRYQVHPASLEYDTVFLNELLVSPNAITVLEDGSFYVANDGRKRNSVLEKIFPLKHGTVIYCNKAGFCTVAASGIAMASGITHQNGILFVSATKQNEVLRYQIQDGGLIEELSPIQVAGPDNIRNSAGALYIASHASGMKLAGHIMDPDKIAPSQVFRYDLESGEANRVFYDEGRRISGASVGLIYDDYLVLGQIVNSYVLVVSAQ